MQENKVMSLADLQAYLSVSPFHQHFDMQVVAADKEKALCKLQLKFSNTLERIAGSKQYHGGVIATLIDIAGNFALINLLSYGVPTINFRVDYLRPATATDLFAITSVRKAGKTVGIVDVDIEDEKGKLVAVGRGCYGMQKG